VFNLIFESPKMQKLSAAILIATCAVLASCKSNEAKPEDTAPATATTATTSTKAAPAPAKPACKPAPVTKKSKKGSKKTAAKTDTTPADCEPAKPKSESGTNEPSAKTIETKPGAAAHPQAPAVSRPAPNASPASSSHVTAPSTVKFWQHSGRQQMGTSANRHASE
jgi:hypothetical protein